MTMRVLLGAVAAFFALTLPVVARAQSTIKQPGAHPRYGVELEPHLTLGVFDPPGVLTGSGPGAGFRASIPIVNRGFVKSINDSVAIGFGGDLVYYGWHSGGDAAFRGLCRRTEPGPNGTAVCVETESENSRRSATMLYAPVVLQWNFWLTSRWSVFGEPGFMIYGHPFSTLSGPSLGAAPVFFVGGRYLLSDRTALTLRLGYPTLSVGLSFLP